MDLEIREPRSEEEFEQYHDLRWRILREPWDQPRHSEEDQHEGEAIHLAAWSGGRLAGVGRVHFNSPSEAQIRYMAVEMDLRGQGVGGAILAELESRARERGAAYIVLNARDTAVGFYEKHGYCITKEAQILFESIPHWELRKGLR